MKYLLDTNAVTRLFRREIPFVENLLAKRRSDVVVPEVVFAEMPYGIERLGKTKRASAIAAFVDGMRAEFEIAVWTQDVSEYFGQIKSKLEQLGQPLEDFDIAIAAHALAIDAVLVTSNRKRFSRINQLVMEEWK
jgi:tRNA(fMet)-specific endonuclease VapC